MLQYAGLVGSLLLAVAFVLISLNAMRVGLLTKFMGYLGMIAAGASLLLIGSAPALLIEVFWLLAVGYLLIGRWPGGDPVAWKSGKAEPWPTAAEIREQRQAGRREPPKRPRRHAQVRAEAGSGRDRTDPRDRVDPSDDAEAQAQAADSKRSASGASRPFLGRPPSGRAYVGRDARLAFWVLVLPAATCTPVIVLLSRCRRCSP